MGDAHAIAKHSEHRLLAGHQVGLHQVLTNAIASGDFQGLVNPGVLLGEGFFLDENRPKLAVSSKSGDGGLVDVAVVGAKPIKHFSNKGGIEGGVEFVGFHGRKRG